MNEDWEEILEIMKAFARVEDITDIIILGNERGGHGVRRIILKTKNLIDKMKLNEGAVVS